MEEGPKELENGRRQQGVVAVCRWLKGVTRRSVTRSLGEGKFQRGEVRKSSLGVKMAVLKSPSSWEGLMQ